MGEGVGGRWRWKKGGVGERVDGVGRFVERRRRMRRGGGRRMALWCGGGVSLYREKQCGSCWGGA